MPQNTVDKLVSLDYEQIESRILAVYSSKPNYMRIPDVITYPKVLKHDEDQEIDKIRKAMNKAFFSG